ncbi:uncharacterized protein [Paramormyrops kingsleyae]|uniref:uncharacterized protein n=1 Tax=Paramormyrops kingsleyae TaxID=1676925 RepID=UPI003B972646
MVSHPCLFVFAVFGLRSTIAGEVKCNTLVDSRNAVLDCHLPCEGPIQFLKWTKNNSIHALWNGTNYTHINRFGFRQPWNLSSQDISLQINNLTKEDSGEYIYTVVSTCETLKGSVNLEIPDMNCTSLVISRNAVLDCHIQYKIPFVIHFLKWTKNNSTLALYNGTNYTHMNRTGFRQPWNPSSQDISLQINNPTKEDSGEYKYSVLSECVTLKGSVDLEIPDVNCTPLVISRNAVLDCHIRYKIPFVIHFLKWSKNNSTLVLHDGTNYTHMNRTGFRQPWNASSQDISLQLSNITEEDSGEYNYSVCSDLFTVTGSVHLEIPGSETLTHNRTDPLKLKGIGTSRHHQVLFVVAILTAVLVLGIIVLWKRKKIQFSCATSEISEHESNLPVENVPLANCRVQG